MYAEVPEPFKTCAACGERKPEASFPKRSGRKTRRGTCSRCLRRRKASLQRGAGPEAGQPHAAAGSAAEAAASPPASGPVPQPPPASPEPAAGKRKRRRRRKRRAPAPAAHGPAAASPEAGPKARTVAAPDSGEPSAEADEARPEPAEPPRKRKRRRRRRRKPGSAPVSASAAGAVRPPDRVPKRFPGPYTTDTSVLDDRGTGFILLRGRHGNGKRWQTEVTAEIAIRMVREGAAGILHPRLIHKLYSKSDMRLLILQRDNYTCRYCGGYGDTIDHVLPKSKGGLTSPANCVCACSACNLKKADKLLPEPGAPDRSVRLPDED
ncbi:HNH endonuclease [Paenibacillus thermoaerophilus]|nr:HNH endonuclease [Paenibacillus thermoaerophilus]